MSDDARREELQQIRRTLGLTQQAMAERFHVAVRTFQRWEHGESRVGEAYLLLARTWLAA